MPQKELAAIEAGEDDLAMLMEADEGLSTRKPASKADAKLAKVKEETAKVKAESAKQKREAPKAPKAPKGLTVAPAKKRPRDESGSDDEGGEHEGADEGPSTWTSGMSLDSSPPFFLVLVLASAQHPVV